MKKLGTSIVVTVALVAAGLGGGTPAGAIGAAALAGSATVNPDLSTSTFPAFTTWTALFTVALANRYHTGQVEAGTANCTAGWNASDTLASGTGSGAMSCTGAISASNCSLLYDRVGLVVSLRIECVGTKAFIMVAALAAVPTAVPPAAFALAGPAAMI